MVTITKHIDQPLTYKFEVEKQLESTYNLENVVFSTNVSENSAEIILNLVETSNTSSVFNYTFFQVFNELNGEENILISISLADENGQIITHSRIRHTYCATISRK